MELARYTLFAEIPAPLRFVVAADVHSAPTDTLWEHIAAEKPDFLVLPGDTVHSLRTVENGLAFLQKAAARYPVFCSIGNHEAVQPLALREAMRHTGIILLDNEAMDYRGLCIGGLTSGFYAGARRHGKTPPPDTAFLAEFTARAGEKLLLCHHPEYYPPYIRPLPIRLTVAGHAHGGQWRWRGQGLFAPGQGLFPKLTDGLWEDRLVISRGLSNPCGIPRFGNPPQLVTVTLAPNAEYTKSL